MSWSYQECLSAVKEAHPDLYPVWYIEEKGQYLFNMLQRGVDQENAPCNFYVADADKEQISSAVPIMDVYMNPRLSEKLEQPFLISAEDQKPVSHGAKSFTHEDFLMHYGIKGMKWGVRRYQNEDGSLTAAGKIRYGGEERPKSQYEKIVAENLAVSRRAKEIAKERGDDRKMGLIEKTRHNEAALGEAIMERNEQPTPSGLFDRNKTRQNDTGKNIAKNLAFSVINPLNILFLGANAVEAGVASHREKSYLRNREKNSKLDPKTGLYKKTPDEYDAQEDLKAVNPRYMDLNSNSKNNCMLCTTTYDLRQRGWDVTARKDSQGYTFGDLKRWYPDAKLEKNSKFGDGNRVLSKKEYAKKTVASLEKYGDGARGNLMLVFSQGGAHSIVWEVKNGQVVFKDGQTGKVYSSPEKVLNKTSANSFTRLDNLKPDMKRIKEECCF